MRSKGGDLAYSYFVGVRISIKSLRHRDGGPQHDQSLREKSMQDADIPTALHEYCGSGHITLCNTWQMITRTANRTNKSPDIHLGVRFTIFAYLKEGLEADRV